MKTALVHDFLIQKGGAEKVLEALYSLFPSPVFTLMDKKALNFPQVQTSYLDHPLFHRWHRLFLPFYPKIVECWDLSSYDLILSSSYAFAKNVLTKSDQLHICYCHTPPRFLYDLYQEELKKMPGILRPIFHHIAHQMRNWDVSASNRVDHFIANSQFVKKRIEKTYGKKVDRVIYPPVDTKKFKSDQDKKENYYLVLSRLVPYKKIDLIVEAFNELPHEQLVVIGEGPCLKKLKRKAKKNIHLLGYQPDAVCIDTLQKSKGLIHMAIEDFGINMVEALAAGTPLLALEAGGAKEILSSSQCGVFIPDQSAEALKRVIEQFDFNRYDPFELRQAAKRFDHECFLREMKAYVLEKYAQFTCSF